MTHVTRASIAYVATQVGCHRLLRSSGLTTYDQVRFALSSSSTFSRSDTITDTELFYNSLLNLLDDADESNEVDELLGWWNR